MVASYQRFEQDSAFGVISSAPSSVWIPSANNTVGQLITAGLENINVWDIKSGELDKKFKPDTAPVGSVDARSNKPSQITSIAYHPNSQLVATGYSDGMIYVWDWFSESIIMKFSGHNSMVTVLQFDATGTRLYSGAADSNIIVWDLVGEVGLFKLRSHKDMITGIWVDSDSEGNDQWLVSSSKDGLVKVWDLKSKQCVETHMAHTSECWGLAIDQELGLCCTLSNDSNFKIWELDLQKPDGTKLVEKGTMEKQSKQRGICIKFGTNPQGVQFMFIMSNDKTVEIFRIRPKDEISKGLKRREKRLREKGMEDEEIEETLTKSYSSIIMHSFHMIRSASKLKSCNWTTLTGKTLNLVVTTATNSIEYYDINYEKRDALGSSKVYTVDLQGHRTDMRSIDMTPDGKLLSTASNGLLKIWNLKTEKCLRTFECGYALCSKILPGGSLVVVGTRAGELQLFDLITSQMLECVETAHEGAIWSLDITYDGKKLITGSADKTVKFWNFSIDEAEKQMKLYHDTTLELGDDILCVKLSAQDNFLAVSLMDNTVKVFYFDTMKFFLSLYGHKLPVLSIDISDDNKMLITSSADKNIKIWGLDFGDCHKSIFAHQDSIMNVIFIPGSHNFFSCSKDADIKYWDGDKFEMIQKLSAHQSEVWGLCINADGDKLVSCSHDHSIRIWSETDDQVFLEEEREKEMDEMYEDTLLNSLETTENDDPSKTVKQNGGEDEEADQQQVSEVHKQTLESLKAGERLMESLDMGIKELELREDYNKKHGEWAQAGKTGGEPMKPATNAILLALQKTPEDYILDTLLKIKASQLEDALLILPFSYVLKFLKFIDYLIKDKQKLMQYLSVIVKNLVFVIKSNYKELVSQKNVDLKLQIQRVKDKLRKALASNVDDLGYNLQGLKIIKSEWDLKHNLEFVDEYEQSVQERKTSKKRVFEKSI